MYEQQEFQPRRLYRDTRNRRIAGVFSGIAEYLNISVCAVRLLGFFAILITFPVGLFAYIVGALILQPMPYDVYDGPIDERFVRSIRQSPEQTFSKVRYRFKNIDNRLQKLERYVTSTRFDLDREFEELERN